MISSLPLPPLLPTISDSEIALGSRPSLDPLDQPYPTQASALMCNLMVNNTMAAPKRINLAYWPRWYLLANGRQWRTPWADLMAGAWQPPTPSVIQQSIQQPSCYDTLDTTANHITIHYLIQQSLSYDTLDPTTKILLSTNWHSNLHVMIFNTTTCPVLFNWYSNLYVMIPLIQQPTILLYTIRYNKPYYMNLSMQQPKLIPYNNCHNNLSNM
jgi:hypothetical protein